MNRFGKIYESSLRWLSNLERFYLFNLALPQTLSSSSSKELPAIKEFLLQLDT